MSRLTPPSDVNSLSREENGDSISSPPLATVGPSLEYWILLFIYAPSFGLAVASIFVVLKGDPVTSLLHPSIGLWIWVTATVIFAAWFAIRGPLVLTWSLTETSLRRGKYKRGLVIWFDEIESIVIGLPDLSPLLRLSRNYEEMVGNRRGALFVRLRGRRVIQLTFLTFHYRGGAKLMKEFLRLNAAKVVGRETYNQDELRKFSRTGVNRIVSV